MNKINKYMLALLVTLVFGCSDFGDVDVNPNASENAKTGALLTNAQTALGGAGAGGGSFLAGLYTQYFSQTQYTDNSLYAIQDLNWAGEMAGSLMDLQTIIDLNSNEKTAATAALDGANGSQIAIARILKAYRFSILTDRYGDMPYSDALKGNTQPKFDSQEDIYTDLFKELDEAVSQFDAAGGTVKGDLIYNGSIESWQKFANSFRLILALRVSKVNPTLGKTQFNDALASPGGIFESNDDNAVVYYPGSPFNNPWWSIGADQGVSETFATIVNNTADARRFAFGNADGNTLVGVPYGLEREAAIAWTKNNPTWSLILNDDFRDQSSSLTILSYGQVMLAMAEASYLGWIDEGDNNAYLAHYEEGLRASWQEWGVYEEVAFDNFIENAAVELAGARTAADYGKIALQRWVTFFPNGAQGWAEWRRTGFPAISPTPFAANPSKEIPIRFRYPTVEYTYNPIGVAQGVEGMGGDTEIIPVWWDVD
jgi:hypothetical protein